MPDRMAKVNKHIQRTFGEIISVEASLPADALVTISGVDTTKNLRNSTVWISILPIEKEREVIKSLKKQMYELQGSFNRALDMHPLPRIKLKIDHGQDYAEQIERKFKQIKSDNENS